MYSYFSESFEGYISHPGKVCKTGMMNTTPEINDINDINQCVTACDGIIQCWGFSFEDKCMLWNESCRDALKQVENTIVTTYVKKN